MHFNRPDARNRAYIRREPADLWVGAATAGALLLILSLTLFPFTFSNPLSITRADVVIKTNLNGLLEPLLNILLFLPLGFGLAHSTRRRFGYSLVAWAAVQVAGTTLSFSVEVLQVLLPTRDPSPIDLLTNSLGTLAGLLVYRRWGASILQTIQRFTDALARRLSLSHLILSYAGYTTFVLLLALRYTDVSTHWHLGNWDSSYPLAVGNEITGDRPWHGTISELQIADRALTEDEVAVAFANSFTLAPFEDALVAHYPLTGQNDLSDQAGLSPRLSWQGAPPDAASNEGLLVDSGFWLKTDTSVEAATQRISAASQFTLMVTLTTDDLTQTGPARIVSISSNLSERNFSLGQVGKDLVIRLRTPVTGVNGVTPAFAVTDFFVSSASHRLLITYSGSALKLYVDRIDNFFVLDLTPELTFVYSLAHVLNLPAKLTRSFIIDLKHYPPAAYSLAYYGITCLPLGVILALAAIRLRRRSRRPYVLSGCGIVVPPLLLHGVPASVNGSPFSPISLLLGIGLLGTFALLLYRLLERSKKQKAAAS